MISDYPFSAQSVSPDLSRFSQQSQLLSAKELCHATPPWAKNSVLKFLSNFSDADHNFPCNFAHQVYEDNTLRAAFIEETTDKTVLTNKVATALTEYVKSAKYIGKRTSLLMFFNLVKTPQTVEEYEAWFWSVLRDLHRADEVEWPFEIPKDPYDPNWAFSFAGQPFFLVCFTPAHINRKSRHSEVPLIIFQPRWIFDGLEGDTSAGIAVRQAIRDAVAVYDNMPASKKLTSYGEGLDWEQYFLPDIKNSIYEKFPISLYEFENSNETPISINSQIIDFHEGISDLLPRSGVVKVVNEVPYERNEIHAHENAETLLILKGSLKLYWTGHAQEDFLEARPGDKILLPKRIPHSSQAGSEGCFYLITDRIVK